jgi:hypothetical protein
VLNFTSLENSPGTRVIKIVPANPTVTFVVALFPKRYAVPNEAAVNVDSR